MMDILIIDGQGGGVGSQLVSSVIAHFPDCTVTAVGTNAVATASMHKAGAKLVATGENAVVVGCRTADIIIGPIGIAIADSLLGEVTPAMAVAVGQSKAKRILIPINQCDNIIVGVSDVTVNKLITTVIELVREIIKV
jgi:hypothetical protein